MNLEERVDQRIKEKQELEEVRSRYYELSRLRRKLIEESDVEERTTEFHRRLIKIEIVMEDTAEVYRLLGGSVFGDMLC